MLLPLQEQPCPAVGVECAEDHALRVGPAQGDLGVFPAPGPAGPQRREQQEVGLVLKQEDISRSQLLDVLADPPHLRGPSRVLVQDVARPFPDVTQGMQLPAQGGLGQSGQTPVGQMGLEQRHGPPRGLVAEVIRWLVQGGLKDRLGVFGPIRGSACARVPPPRRGTLRPGNERRRDRQTDAGVPRQACDEEVSPGVLRAWRRRFRRFLRCTNSRATSSSRPR